MAREKTSIQTTESSMCCEGCRERRSEFHDTSRRVVCFNTGIASVCKNVSLGHILVTAGVIPNPTAPKVSEVRYREIEVKNEERTTLAHVTEKKPRTFGGAASHDYVIQSEAPGNLPFNFLTDPVANAPRVTVDQNGAYDGIASEGSSCDKQLAQELGYRGVLRLRDMRVYKGARDMERFRRLVVAYWS